MPKLRYKGRAFSWINCTYVRTNLYTITQLHFLPLKSCRKLPQKKVAAIPKMQHADKNFDLSKRKAQLSASKVRLSMWKVELSTWKVGVMTSSSRLSTWKVEVLISPPLLFTSKGELFTSKVRLLIKITALFFMQRGNYATLWHSRYVVWLKIHRPA